jgi:glycosyltransferase involved in cell wall biosynthesis
MLENIVFLGVTDNYPFKYSANNSKNELLAKSITERGAKASIIDGLNGMSFFKENYFQGRKDDVNHYNFKKGKLLQILKNALYTFKILKSIKVDKKNDYLFIGYNYFPIFIFYVLLGRILNYRLIVIITEWHVYFEKKSLFKKLNYLLFDHLFGYVVDGIIPISDVIKKKISHFKKPVLKIPILADFNTIKVQDYSKTKSQEEYFLYCGDISYLEIIEFTINTVQLLIQKKIQIKLHLIVNGKECELVRIQDLIESKRLNDQIIVRSKLPFEELIHEYQDALALLIPLRTKMQDTARFPHKIGEYIATARPIITGNVGELTNYFSDNENAYLANDYSIHDYAALMEKVILQKNLANIIGQRGRELGVKNFHYSNYGDKILKFIKTLN